MSSLIHNAPHTEHSFSNRWLPPPLLFWFAGGALMLAVLFVNRLALLYLNQRLFDETTGAEYLQALLVGLRFDLATAAITVTLPVILLWLPAPLKQRLFIARICRWLMTILIVAATGILWADLLYFSEGNRHITVEPAMIRRDVLPMLMLVVREHPFAFPALLAEFAGTFLAVRWLAGRIHSNEARIPGWGIWRLAMFLPFAGLAITAGRGGWQHWPLKSADAVIGDNPALGNLALNGWYSFLVEARRRERSIDIMPREEAVAIVQSLVRMESDRFDNPDYPLLRRASAPNRIVAEGEKLNVVVILVESFNAEFLQSFGGEHRVMPFLDSLASDAAIFTNCHALGTRSFRGVVGTLTSFPILSEDAYRITFLLPKLTGLGTILREQGYGSCFIHAAAHNSMGVSAAAALAGYPKFLAMDAFDRKDYNGSWGIWDHVALARLSAELDRIPEPLTGAIFTLSTHGPWTLPDGFDPPFGSESDRPHVYNVFAYLDRALRDFFALEASKERFRRTLYVIVGDHTTHASEAERFRVACLFYAPGRLAPRIDSSLCSQLDVPPTILDLAGIESPHASFGASLFDTSGRLRGAAMFEANLLQLRESNRILVTDLALDRALFDASDRGASRRNLLGEEPDVAAAMRHRLGALYQVSELLARENRVGR